MSTFKSRQNDIFDQIYFNSTVFNIRLTRQLHNNNLFNMKSKPWVNWLQSYFYLNLYQKKYAKIELKSQSTTKHRIFKGNKFTPVQRILHQRCWWCWRHLEGLFVQCLVKLLNDLRVAGKSGWTFRQAPKWCALELGLRLSR